MNAINKMNDNLESYCPNELPQIINAVEKAASNQYEEYKSIEFRMNYIELPESLKFAGVPYSLYPDFANIGRFHDVYKQKMMDKYAPYTEVGFSGTCNDSGWEYIFGCQIRSMEDIPEGLISVDTGVKRFTEITFRAKSVYELVGDEKGPGEAMVVAGEYIKKVWLPKHMDEVNIVDLNHMTFKIGSEEKPCYCGMIEIYKVEFDHDVEMSFYIPLI